MLNPSLQNFSISFDNDFFPESITKKYDEFLFHLNTPFKDIKTNLHESIQVIQVPGINIAPLIIQGMDNTGKNPRNPAYNQMGFPHTTQNHAWEGNIPWWEVLDNTQVTVTFRNNIINFLYCYEMAYKRFLRDSTYRINQFGIDVIMKDSAEIDMFHMKFRGCFITTLPGLEFAYNQSFNESKSFDVGIQVNKVDVELNIPDFKKINYNIFDKNRDGYDN